MSGACSISQQNIIVDVNTFQNVLLMHDQNCKYLAGIQSVLPYIGILVFEEIILHRMSEILLFQEGFDDYFKKTLSLSSESSVKKT